MKIDINGDESKVLILAAFLLDNPEDIKAITDRICNPETGEMIEQVIQEKTDPEAKIHYEEQIFQGKKAFCFFFDTPNASYPFKFRFVRESDHLFTCCLVINSDLPEESPFLAEPREVNPLMKTSGTILGVAVYLSAWYDILFMDKPEQKYIQDDPVQEWVSWLANTKFAMARIYDENQSPKIIAVFTAENDATVQRNIQYGQMLLDLYSQNPQAQLIFPNLTTEQAGKDFILKADVNMTLALSYLTILAAQSQMDTKEDQGLRHYRAVPLNDSGTEFRLERLDDDTEPPQILHIP